MKSQITLLPPKGILAAAEVMTLANTPNKHLDEKWRTMTPATHVDAALRHLYAWLSGESRDPELGTSHLANASVRLLMASERELDERERIANTCPPWDDRARYTHVKEAPLPAPANPEWEAYVDGTLGKGNALEDNPKQEIAKVGDWIRITSGPVIGREALVISDTLDDVRNRWLTIKYPGGRSTIRDKNCSIIPPPQKDIDDIKPSEWEEWADRAKINTAIAEKVIQGIDSIKPSEWDAANTSFLAAQEVNKRYLEATEAQREGDEE